MPEKERQSPHYHLMKEIGILEQLGRTRLERLLPDGLTVSQFGLLDHLARLGGTWSPVRLAAAFQVTKGAMTNTIGKLAAQDYIQVEPDPKDQRGKQVKLTDKGMAVRNDCQLKMEPLFDMFSEAITPDELELILPILARLRQYLDTHRV